MKIIDNSMHLKLVKFFRSLQLQENDEESWGHTLSDTTWMLTFLARRYARCTVFARSEQSLPSLLSN